MLVRDHSPSPLAHEAPFLIAEDYGRLAYYQRAAEFYEAFARKDPRDDRAASALMRAARLRIDLIPSD